MGPTLPPKVYSSITVRFIHLNNMVQMEIDKVKSIHHADSDCALRVSLGQPFLTSLGCESAADARFSCLDVKLVLRNNHHLVKIQVAFFE